MSRNGPEMAMDYVRHGEIQGRSLVFFKAHCPCILPCLTQSITKDLPGLKSIIQALQIRLSTVLIKAGSIKVNNFISGACKCTAMVFFREEKGRLYTIPLITNLWCQPRLFSSSFIRCLCDQQRNKVTKMLGFYSVKSSTILRQSSLKRDFDDAT